MTEQKSPEEMKIAKIPEILPIMPLFNTVIFPNMVFPLEVFGEQSMTLVDEAMAVNRIIGLVMSRKLPVEIRYQPEDFYTIGTGVVILKMAKSEDNKAQLLIQGISRFKIREFIDGKPYPRAQVETLEDQVVMDIEIEALVTNLTGLFEKDGEAVAFFSSGIWSDGQVHCLARDTCRCGCLRHQRSGGRKTEDS
jgi:ATP-dependent Lon protease